ncbi:uncharacterized protein LOC127287955 [Leptopilina boulardi]|uniref:uncharacterized protein LOC127287955 n=1 Tax=Leptopilina boulardi TaxID=63433 RepID=UPI0021F5A2F4|nr:uncharacterized protein LOC127287955 [Leptopilina boulardi]
MQTVIVMDNAPYHSVKIEKLPNMQWKKNDIRNWLLEKGVTFKEWMLKPMLLNLVKNVKHLYNKYIIDEIDKKDNKIILRLPPYHCELNPIEMAWSVVKGHVKTNNTTFKLPDVLKLFHEGIQRVTPQLWSNFINHV